MCSIIGYYGNDPAAPLLVRGLSKMEYRGYDSVGVATQAGSQIALRKGVGKVEEVNRSARLDELSGQIGIGHTRWATHGKVTGANAHPHASNSGGIAVVHNGIIENYTSLKKELGQEGFVFSSDTDTEIISNLLQKNLAARGDARLAMRDTLSRLQGRYAFVALLNNGTIAAARFHLPLIVGVGHDSYFLSSDVLGFIEKTDDAIYLDNGDYVIIDGAGLHMYDRNGEMVHRRTVKVSREFADVYKGRHAHFTKKEILEQPETILVINDDIRESIRRAAEAISAAGSIFITGSGTSYNAALIAQHVMSKHTGIRIEPVISSELPHAPVPMRRDSLLVAISQSGESADVLEAVAIAKKSGARILSIVNGMISPLAQESDLVVGINCGPEIGVAATKSFTSQLGVIYRTADAICAGRSGMDFSQASDAISQVLKDADAIRVVAQDLRETSDIYVLGRGIHYPIALEAALKLKELAYVHAEGIAGGELKHGPLALMDSNVYVIIINPGDSTYDDMVTSASEIRARGAKIIGISDRPNDAYDYWIKIPAVPESIYPMVEIVPVQLLSYYLALEKDADPDYPRNLAKSVTVR